MAFFITEDCTNCGSCAEVCPEGAINQLGSAHVITDKCIDCASCVEVCPVQAIQPVAISVWEFMEFVYEAVVFMVPVVVVGETRDIHVEKSPSVKVRLEKGTLGTELSYKFKEIGLNSYRQSALLKHLVKNAIITGEGVPNEKESVNEVIFLQSSYKGVNIELTCVYNGSEYEIIRAEYLK